MSFHKSTLKNELAHIAGATIYARGLHYYRDGAVVLISVENEDSSTIEILADVIGTKKYRTSVLYDTAHHDFREPFCDCPYEESMCKHTVAVLLAFFDEYEEFLTHNLDASTRQSALHAWFQNRTLPFGAREQRHVSLASRSKDVPTPVVISEVRGDAQVLRQEHYCIIGLHHGVMNIRIMKKGQENFSWRALPDGILTNPRVILTESERALLAYLRDTDRWGSAFDKIKVLQMVRTTDLSIFLNNTSIKSQLFFSETPDILNAELCLIQKNERAVGIELRVSATNWDEKTCAFLVGREHIAFIRCGTIAIFQTTSTVTQLLARIPFQGFQTPVLNSRSHPYWPVALEDEELSVFPQLRSDLEPIFHLNSEISKHITVEWYPKPLPVFVVNCQLALGTLEVEASMDYGFVRVPLNDTCYRSTEKGARIIKRRIENGREHSQIDITGDKISVAPLDIRGEKEVFTKLISNERLGFSSKLVLKLIGAKKIADFVETRWPIFASMGIPFLFVADRLDITKMDFRADLAVNLDTANDLLAFDVSLYLGETAVSLEAVRQFVNNQDAYLQTHDGQTVSVANRGELEQFVALLSSYREADGGHFEGGLFHAPELREMVESSPHYQAKLSESFTRFMSEAQSGLPVEPVALPLAVKGVLRGYQEEGIAWLHFLRKYRFGGILADEMGLGKTIQALTVLSMNPVKGKPSIVVCPKTLLFNWEDEAVKFFPELKVLIVEGPHSLRIEKLAHVEQYDLVVTSYPALRRDAESYASLQFNYCILDEAQSIKNHHTQSAKVVKSIHAEHRLALTGTPLENGIGEIWSIFDYLMPGFLGSHHAFTERFQNPIMKLGDRSALDALRSKIATFMLRRTKSAVLAELPDKVERTSLCRLGDQQNILYQEILAQVKGKIFSEVEKGGFARSQIHILAGLTKLRQVCNHPALLMKGSDYMQYESAKLEMFLELVDEIVSGGRKVLVFSQFTSMLSILANELQKKSVEYAILTGKTQNRKGEVEEFTRNSSKNVFLISLKAGGTGLNLVSADNVIIFDPWWNPSVEAQAIDRAHRIGQTQTVNVYRLLTKGTIEERIVKLQEKKKFLFDNLVGETKDMFEKLTWEDVKALFEE